MPNQDDAEQWGRFQQKVDSLVEKVDKLHADVTDLKGTMNKGWGLVLGVVMVSGLFANELVAGFRRLLGLEAPPHG